MAAFRLCGFELPLLPLPGKRISAGPLEEGGIRPGSYLGETASPALPIKFPQPQRLGGASRQTALQAGGENESPRLPPASTCPGPARRAPSCPPPPAWASSCPCPKALHQLGGGWGQDAGLFPRQHFLIDQENKSTRLSASPGFLLVPQPSVELETFSTRKLSLC